LTARKQGKIEKTIFTKWAKTVLIVAQIEAQMKPKPIDTTSEGEAMARKNNKRYELTWSKRGDSGRWRKRHKGKWLSYSGDGGKEASYPAAWAAFKRDKAIIDKQLTGHNPLLLWLEDEQERIIRDYCDSKSLRMAWKVLEDAKSMAQHLSNDDPLSDTPFGELVLIKRKLSRKVSALLDGEVLSASVGKPILDRGDRPPLAQIHNVESLRAMAQAIAEAMLAAGKPYVIPTDASLEAVLAQATIPITKAPKPPAGVSPWKAADDATTIKPTTLGELTQVYLADKRKPVDTGKRSKGRWDNTRQQLDRFLASVGSDLPLDGITSPLLNEYRRNVEADESISDATKNERLRGVKDLLRWAVGMEYLATEPKMIRQGYAVKQTAKAITLPSVSDVAVMLDAATDRVKLYTLLALNTGMTQKDMSDLKRSEITFGKVVTIRRKRSKTIEHDTTPIVTYYLWPRTAKLLKQELATDGERALLNADGGMIVSDEIREDGKRKKCDSVDSAWDRLRRKTGKSVQFKMLRKLAASTLASNAEFSRYAQYFLGHAPTNIADTNYIVPSEEQFQAALVWLEEKLFGKPTKPARRR